MVISKSIMTMIELKVPSLLLDLGNGPIKLTPINSQGYPGIGSGLIGCKISG